MLEMTTVSEQWCVRPCSLVSSIGSLYTPSPSFGRGVNRGINKSNDLYESDQLTFGSHLAFIACEQDVKHVYLDMLC